MKVRFSSGAKENRTLPPTLQKSVASLGTCGPEINGRGEIRTHITYYVNRNQLCIHAVNKTNPCTPIYASRWDQTTGVNSLET